MNNIIKIIWWLVITSLLFSLFCSMLTAASTILNILSIVLLTFWIYISHKTKCFTKFNKNEKDI